MIPSSIPAPSPMLLKARGQGSPQGYPGHALPPATRSRSFAPPSPPQFAPSRSLLRHDHRLLVAQAGGVLPAEEGLPGPAGRGVDAPAGARGERLSELDRTRDLAEAEIGGLKATQERVESLELGRDALLESMAAKVLGDLDGGAPGPAQQSLPDAQARRHAHR